MQVHGLSASLPLSPRAPLAGCVQGCALTEGLRGRKHSGSSAARSPGVTNPYQPQWGNPSSSEQEAGPREGQGGLPARPDPRAAASQGRCQAGTTPTPGPGKRNHCPHPHRPLRENGDNTKDDMGAMDSCRRTDPQHQTPPPQPRMDTANAGGPWGYPLMPTKWPLGHGKLGSRMRSTPRPSLSPPGGCTCQQPMAPGLGASPSRAHLAPPKPRDLQDGRLGQALLPWAAQPPGSHTHRP